MAIMIEVWGDYAAFNRPEMKTERVTYDCITPSAARGILEAIYWHPGLKWIIDSIYVCNPIKTTNVKRNEVMEKINARNVKTAMKKNEKDIFICLGYMFSAILAFVFGLRATANRGNSAFFVGTRDDERR